MRYRGCMSEIDHSGLFKVFVASFYPCLRRRFSIAWLDLEEFPSEHQILITGSRCPWHVKDGEFSIASVQEKYLKSGLNTLLLQLIQYILRQHSMPPVLSRCPCSLFSIQPSIIHIHETARSCCKFPHHQ